jgi:hypothetical protein
MKKLLLIGLIIVCAGCEKQIGWPIQSAEPGSIAVSGKITDERKAHAVSLMYPALELNGAGLPVTGAVVSIADGSTTWLLNEADSLKGTYYSDTTVIGIPGRSYTLNIQANGKNYTATDYMPSVTWFSPLRYAINKNGLYHVTWVANSYNPQTPAIYEILLDWSAVTGYEHLNPSECRATLYYFTLTTIDVSEIFAPEFEKVLFPAGTKITERKYSLSAAHENFIRCLLLETNWRGGFFDAASANLPTNMSEGAVGFFSASSVVSLSLTVTP